MEKAANAGTLYLAATPIGNLEDITYRAVRIMGEADVIAAEDTRRTRKLLAHYDIHTPLISYHEHNKQLQGAKIIRMLLAGKDVVCVSDAGMPGISDPGSQLAALAIEANVEVTPLPGANAALAALICSGLDTRRFVFVGFLPKTAKKARELLSSWASCPETLVLYEAPHNLTKTMELAASVFGAARPAVLARELTKTFEEFERGTLAELLTKYQAAEPRGEYVLLIAGAPSEEVADATPADAADAAELAVALMADGMAKKEALREAAHRLGLSRREVYAAFLQREKG